MISIDRDDSNNFLGTVDFAAGRGSDNSNGGTQFRFFTQPRSTGAAEDRLLIDREGSVLFNQNSATNYLKYQGAQTGGVSGRLDLRAIKFHDGNAELDDYEEGTWSPDFYGLSSAFNSYYNKTGTYVKIGSVCHINGFIQLNGTPAFTSSSDYLRLGPLPFAGSNQGGGYYATVGGVSCQGFNWHDNDYSNSGQIACGVQNHNGTYYVIFQASGNNNIRGVVKNSAIGSLNPIIEFQLTYRV